MPNRTLYIRDEDEELWKEAEELSGQSTGGSLSRFIAEALRRHVLYEKNRLSLMQHFGDEMDRIVVTVDLGEDSRVRKAFHGTWVVDDWDGVYKVAITSKGRIAVHDTAGGEGQHELHVFDTMNEFAAWCSDESLLEMVVAVLGWDFVIEVDI